MLSPNTRQTYLDGLRAPAGYRLESALATTFSLDLLTLMTAPVVMALQDYQIQGDITEDPVALLEAIRKTADRFAVFCQRGRIAIPSKSSVLYGHLESVVVEAESPHPEGVFHPKTWFLRFEPLEGQDSPFYRFICLTRNLTFDCSWDTSLVLEGHLVKNRSRGFSRNRPLSQFVKTLPSLATGDVSPKIRKIVRQIANEIQRVRFETPEGFDKDYRIIPLGIKDYTRLPRLDPGRRTFVMSPFVAFDALYRFIGTGRENIVVSRPESLDELKTTTINKLSENTRFYIMDTAAETAEEPASTDAHADFTPHTGLHAKLFVIENGSRVQLLTGSANATNAAMKGRNVELMVALSGPRRNIGIKALLGNEDNRYTLQGLLLPYQRESEAADQDKTAKKLERTLDNARRLLSKADISVTVHEAADGTYKMIIRLENGELSLPENITGRCYPISLPEAQGQKISRLTTAGSIEFSGLTIELLTGFIAFELTGRLKKARNRIAFVLNLPVAGLPQDRDKQILKHILHNSERFVRYLLLILADDKDRTSGDYGIGRSTSITGGLDGMWGIPLLEELVRAYSRNPEKIKQIDRLVRDLQTTGSEESVLPEGFDEIWRAFTADRRLRN